MLLYPSSPGAELTIGVALQDSFYVSSWQVFFICMLLFQGLNNLAVCILRYRLKLEGAGKTALQQIKWIRELGPLLIDTYRVHADDRLAAFFTIFFSGLSFKIACSLLSHLFSVNVRYVESSSIWIVTKEVRS